MTNRYGRIASIWWYFREKIKIDRMEDMVTKKGRI